jgi:hypothetical protein
MAGDPRVGLIVRCDPAGAPVWERRYRSVRDILDLRLTPDQGCIFVGSAPLSPFGALCVLRTDSLGDSLWAVSVPQASGAGSVEIAADGGYVVAGHANAPLGGAYVAEFDDSGNLSWWSNPVTNDYWQRVVAIRRNPAGGFTLAVSIGEYEASPPFYVQLARLDVSGSLIWERYFSYDRSTRSRAIEVLPDGSVMVVGYSDNGGPEEDGYLARVSLEGNAIWQRTLGEAGWDCPYDIVDAGDGGYVVAGMLGSEAFLLKVDENGFCQP